MDNNKFKNLLDLCLMLDGNVITKKVFESPILSESLDCFDISRERLIELLEDIITCLRTKQRL